MNVPSAQLMQQEKRRKQNALVISRVTGVIFALVSIVIGPLSYSESGVNGLWGIGITAAVSLSAFVGAFQISRERVSQGIGIIIATILLMAFAIPVIAQGQGLALGIMVLVIVTGISSVTLPPKWATRAIVSAFATAAFITLADLYLPDFGLPSNPSYSNPIAVITSIVYIFFILRRYNAYALRTKIIIAFTLVTIVPLIALGFINSRSFAQHLQTQSQTQLTSLAKIVADEIDGFIATQLDSVRTDSKQSAFISYLELPPYARNNSDEEVNARLALLSLTRKDPVFINSIALLDPNGKDILDTLNKYKDRNESGAPYFIRPIQTGLPYASNILFNGQEAQIYFSTAIKSQSGQTIGVLRVEYHAKVIQSILRSIDPGAPGTILTLVDSSTYMRVGYTGNRDSLFKSYENFSDLDLAALQAESRLPSGARENALSGTDDSIIAGLNNLQQQPFFNAFSQSLGSEATNTGLFLKTQPWIALVRQSTKIYLEPVDDQNRTTILISLILIILSVGAGFLASQILTSPLITLARVAEQITAGDRNARAETSTEDEIGALAASFNRMTEELNQSLSGLEEHVAERTTDLKIARQQSEKRAHELQSVGEIAKIITGEQKLESLFPLITRLVSERFGYYHTGIFLLNETKQFAVLQAANSDGGKFMIARGHRLEVGESGIVGYVAKFGTPRIALDVGLDAVHFDNSDLPNTRSEMALPLKVRDQIMGVLDVQSEKPGAFNENDVNTLSILADQIAIALENARLFTQTQQALSEAQALYRNSAQDAWLTFSREEVAVGYHQSLGGGRKLTTPIDSDEIRQAMNLGNVLIFDTNEGAKEPSIVVPIKLRGQVIGALNVKAPTTDRRWSNDEINLVEAISERLSLALENARLIQDSQRQVIKEQTISEVTGKIGASINLRNVMQTAVEELGRAIPGSEVILKFEQKNGNTE